MSNSIGAEQTAFLPKRHIADGIHTAQLIPAALSSAAATGGVVMLDIAKAYDTVDRAFLLRIMRAHGAFAGMRSWVELLLRDTDASTCVRGHSSRALRWHAGVRQGCPLSPLLYLFVGEALACWLRSNPALGVVVDGRRYTSVHFADDAKIYLSNLSQDLVGDLFTHLQVFGSATGQEANMRKSCGVPQGTLRTDEPGTTQDIPVQQSAKSLGVMVQPVPVEPLQITRQGLRATVRDPAPRQQPVSAEWAPRLRSMGTMCNMVSGLPLSTMGRGLSASSYALSKVLFHAEFEGLPQQVENKIQKTLDTQ
jgi:Reverse transcriptase (RNA-dependent DNA polymerase)